MAAAPTEAAVAANVEDNVGRELNTFAQYVEVWRPPFVAVICTLIGIFGAWWVLALMQGLNPRDVMRSGWADESHRIEDLRHEEAIKPQPMKPAREVVTDAETGEELVKVKPREYWRKRKGKVQKLDIQPEIPPDEAGVTYDVGQRTAVTLGGVMELPESTTAGPQNEAQQESPSEEAEGEAVAVKADEVEQPNSSEEQDFIILEDESAAAEEVAGNDEAGDENPAENAERDLPEQVDHPETPEREEPETRESHMLPNVAAE
jgi:hypothetical protein